MKKTLLLMVGIVMMLTSCSQDEAVTADNNVMVTFSMATDNVQSRAGGATTYVCEVYKAANTEGARLETHTSTSSNFTIALEKEQTYSFLFWAEAGAGYNTADLKAVALTDATAMGTEAWAGKLDNQKITTETAIQVTLKHAVAQVKFHNTGTMTAGTKTIEVTYPNTYKYNVSTNALTEVGTNQAMVRTFTTDATGDAVIATDYIFASADKELITLKLKGSVRGAAEPEREIANVPVQMNYTTTLKGTYYQTLSTSFSTSLSAFESTAKEDTF